MTTPAVWTVVQHSGYGYNHDPDFQQGLETRHVETRPEQDRIAKAGGLMFDSYTDAEDFADAAMYPPGYQGLMPRAAGTFSNLQIDGLAIYIPVREVVG
jgi:hypothetical protein